MNILLFLATVGLIALPLCGLFLVLWALQTNREMERFEQELDQAERDLFPERFLPPFNN